MNTTTDLESARKAAFLQLKPRCIAVSQHALASQTSSPPASINRDLAHSLENLLHTVRNIADTNPHALNQSLGDYIFFPLSHVFRQHQALSDRVVELALRILKVLVETCWRMDIPKELAKQLVILVTFIVGGAPSPKVQGGGGQRQERVSSEESKIAGCEVLAGLFRGMVLSSSTRGLLTEEQNLPALGHLITTLLEVLLQSTEVVELGRASLDALTVLFKDLIEDKDTLASFLPGVVSQLSKVLAPQSKTTRRSHQILSSSLDLLSYILSTVLGDSSLSDLPTISSLPTTAAAREEGLKITRSTSWFTATSTQVKLALESILIRTRVHPKPTVRRSAANLCEALLTNCTKSLSVSDNYTLIVDTLVILSGDDSPQLASHAGYTLQISAVTNPKISDTLQQSLHGWILSLPRVMAGQDEDLKTKVVERVSAGIKMLNEMGGGSEVLTDLVAQNIRDSLEATKAFSEEDTVGIEVGEGGGILALEPAKVGGAGGEVGYPELILGHRTQKDTITSLKKLLATVGATNSETVATLANTYIRDARDGDPVSLWMALNLLRSTSSSASVVEREWLNPDLEQSDFDGLTQELFSVTHEILLKTTSATAYLPQLDSPTSTLTTCLALESLSYIASTQKTHFKSELVDILYPLIHLLGSPSPVIARHAILTINNVSNYCGYSSPREMVLGNVDYLVNALGLKLNTCDISPQAPKVLGMVVRLAGKRVLPFLDDIVEGVVGALEAYHGYEGLSKGLVGVLGEIVEVAAAEGDGEVKMIGEGSGQTRKKKKRRLTPRSLVQRFKEEEAKRKKKKLEDVSPPSPTEPTPHGPWGVPKSEKRFDPEAYLSGELDADELDADELPPSSLEPPPPPPTSTYTLIKKITTLSQNLLTHPSPALRLQLVNLVATSVDVLGQDEKEWLPVVSEIWPGLVGRLWDKEPGVVVGAANAVGKLAVGGAGEFISSRVNEAWFKGGEGEGGRGGGGGSGSGGGICGLLRRTKEQLDRERGARYPTSSPTSTNITKRPPQSSGRSFSPSSQIYTTLIHMLSCICQSCSIADLVLDQILEIIADDSEFGFPGSDTYRELLAAMRSVNRDAVWVEVMRRKWERGEWGGEGWMREEGRLLVGEVGLEGVRVGF